MAFGIDQLAPLAILLVIAAIVLSVGSDILSTIQASYVGTADGCNSSNRTGCNYNYNASGSALSGLNKVSSWQPTIRAECSG